MTAQSTTPAVELIGVTKRYGAATAIADLNLAISAGTTLGLIGPNGAGKSTTIRILMGMLAPTAGQAKVFGINVAEDPAGFADALDMFPSGMIFIHG